MLTILFLSMASVSRFWEGVILFSAIVLLSTNRSGHTSPPPSDPDSPDPEEGVPENCFRSHWAWLMDPRVGEVGEARFIFSTSLMQAILHESLEIQMYLSDR